MALAPLKRPAHRDGVVALRAERAELLDLCHTLSDSQWRLPSMAPGWTVQDVVSHIGAGCHAIFTTESLKLLLSKDIEQSNDEMVWARRVRRPDETVAEYERWSARIIQLATLVTKSPLTRLPVPLAELGRFPVGLLLTGAMVFDHHTHMRHDLAPALGLSPSPPAPRRMAVVIDWMLAVLGNQLRSGRPEWLSRPVGLRLTGPGGGAWTIQRDGRILSGIERPAVEIVGDSSDFPSWATKRSDWRDYDINIVGDTGYGAVFLDELNVV
ncbi:hypothetical protein A5784_03800 [Mycobacterium sp. 852013-50091_SCH5140682]|uniref:maleylpyruvate isomerase family mycothiol-dependent enzyme n=1 Tax=Mycobacterium sp. 852013-50091_SCH5140682 TaxID=1834109 RepID=UPI0007EA1F3C|nr:maleylpyruvate isomerase family mycothiol-dependent enzyme [Mycobacterium sp. 852013-50091_SCH5140682]OBC12076.1 hypothetical protein A5784_03800 [Mycobacterium sp. 852013-50091_SCH5140682]